MNVHVANTGILPEEVIVERRHLEPIIEQGGHDRIDLFLQQDRLGSPQDSFDALGLARSFRAPAIWPDQRSADTTRT
jgi:hypothetical protein